MSASSAPTGPRRRGRLRWVLLALLLLPVVEIAVLVLVGQQIGFWWTFLLVVVLGLVGVALARRESGRTFGALRRAVDSGKMPADEVTDAILVMIGAFFLILPGFVSDVLGLFMVLPVTRPWSRRILQALVVSRAMAGIKVYGGPGPGAGAGFGGGHGASSGSRRTGFRGDDIIDGEIVAEDGPGGGSAGGTGDTGPQRLDP